tara:strand:- start:390 stop:818 length:429 start_codon:yes stop_codon:yes gene_type:complete
MKKTRNAISKIGRRRLAFLMEFSNTIREAQLDPNSTYVVDLETRHGEYRGEDDVKKVSGDPLTVAKAVKKRAISGGDGIEEFVSAFELDKDTYYILTSDDTMTVVGRPRSPKYGAFWTSDGGEELYDLIDQMDEDSMKSKKV